MKVTLSQLFVSRFLLLLVLMTATFVSYADETTGETQPPVSPIEPDPSWKYDYDYFKEITYEWTDSEGYVHKSNLTESATEYEQIVAMLREVYMNPFVPGFVKDPAGWEDPASKNEYINVPYEPCIAPHNPYGMTGKFVIPVPIEGMTALIVELKDDYKYEGANKTYGVYKPVLDENGNPKIDDNGNEVLELDYLDPVKMLKQIKAVTLLTESLRIDGDPDEPNTADQGYLFNYVGMLDKFFVITKGNNRIASNSQLDDAHTNILVGHAPFYNMFEEFSPSNSGPTYKVYENLGEKFQFSVDHNCTSIMNQNHIMSMSPEGKSEEYPMNFMFFVPDYRFTGDSRRHGSPTDGSTNSEAYEYYTYYNSGHMPYFFFYDIEAKIVGKPDYNQDIVEGTEIRQGYIDDRENPLAFTDENGDPIPYAKVLLEWESTYNTVVGFRAEEEFDVYRVVNDVIQNEPLKKSEYTINRAYYVTTEDVDGTKLETPLKLNADIDKDPTLITEKRVCQIYIKEEIPFLSKDVFYIVKGRRYPSDFELMESNIVRTRILGSSTTETLSIEIAGNPVSKYDMNQQKNEYSNAITLYEPTQADLRDTNNKILRAGHIQSPKVKGRGEEDFTNTDTPGTEFILKRFDTSGEEYAKDVAKMTVTQKEYEGGNGWGAYVYTAKISYVELTDEDATNKYHLPLEAQFKSAAKYPGNENVDEERAPIMALDKNNDIFSSDETNIDTDVDANNQRVRGFLVKFTDIFSADTSNGDHPGAYYYYLTYHASVDVDPSNDNIDMRRTAYSNQIYVSVPVRSLKVGYMPYSEEEILSDSRGNPNGLLPVNKPGIQFETRSNPSLINYTVYDVNTGKSVVHVTRMPTGQLNVQRRNERDRLVDYSKENHSYWTKIPVEMDCNPTPSDEFVLVITYLNSNTYGNSYYSLHSRPEPEFYWREIKYDRESENGGGKHIYKARTAFGSKNLEGPESAENYEVFNYRLWGQENFDEENLHDDNYKLISAFGEDYGREDVPARAIRRYTQGLDGTIDHEYEFESHEASEETPVNFKHYLRLYAKIPDSLNIKYDDSPNANNVTPQVDMDNSPGYILADTEQDIKTTDRNGISTSLERLPVDDGIDHYYDPSGRELDPENLPSGVIIRVRGGKVDKIII